MQGWIKFHREILDKPIWQNSTPEQKTILQTILLMANHQENEWEWKGERYKVQPGQFISSLEKIAERSGKGVSLQNVRTAIKRFEKYDFLTNESTNQNRLITIVNWGIYQGGNDDDNKEPNKQLTSNQQATNKQLTTNKNVKNENNDNNVNKKTSSHKFEICDMDNAKYLFELMQENNPNVKEPNYEKWADTFRLIRERDGRTLEQIDYLIRWTQQDDFWSSNILSPTKLRKQWDQLVLKAKQDHDKRQGKIENKGNETPYDYDPQYDVF